MSCYVTGWHDGALLSYDGACRLHSMPSFREFASDVGGMGEHVLKRQHLVTLLTRPFHRPQEALATRKTCMLQQAIERWSGKAEAQSGHWVNYVRSAEVRLCD